MVLSLQDHISSIYSYFPGKVVELEPMMIYQISMQCSRAQLNYFLTATLPPSFPTVCPIITVEPALNHAWINANMDIIGHPALKSWNGMVYIGKILKDIELEFSLRPPNYSMASTGANANQTQRSSVVSRSLEHKNSESPTLSFPEIDGKTYPSMRKTFRINF